MNGQESGLSGLEQAVIRCPCGYAWGTRVTSPGNSGGVATWVGSKERLQACKEDTDDCAEKP